jgi:hypothetical protein
MLHRQIANFPHGHKSKSLWLRYHFDLFIFWYERFVILARFLNRDAGSHCFWPPEVDLLKPTAKFISKTNPSVKHERQDRKTQRYGCMLSDSTMIKAHPLLTFASSLSDSLLYLKISEITSCDVGTLNSAVIEKYVCETQISIAYATKKDKKRGETGGGRGRLGGQRT